ncbi:MAG: UTP--glucose-1-phosphate uridylyltransferase [Bacteriovoracaceae bacterium]|nr:UTP--glucose-1-phosphate uridylyltransferase [Bacteriovoracaceae bacterium]
MTQKLDNNLEKLVFEYDTLADNDRERLQKEIKDELKFDDLNMAYFLALYKKYKRDDNDKKQVFIHEDNLPGKDRVGIEIAWPTAIAPRELMKELPYRQYSDLLNEIDPKEAKNCAVWIKKMQAGTGSSIVRNSYLSQKLHKPLEEVKIGAKGTDLFIETQDGKLVSLAEIQLMQSIHDAKEGIYGGIALHDIVSNETEKPFDAIWDKPCPYENGKTYSQIVNETDDIIRFKKSFQYHMPTIDEEGEISFNRVAPGGHGLFGVDAIRAAYIDELRPDFPGKILISSIGNGEDLGSSPDPVMVAWMAKEKIPIAMVTTTKTNIDLKGGQISIVKNEDEKVFVTIIEKAQAEESNQIRLFYDLGLGSDDHEAFFNTNMALINYTVLTPIIKNLIDEIGEDAFMEVIAPDLIQNVKKQVDTDGKERKYMQLEGAMGSVILNLDRYWRTKYGKPLVHILNVHAVDRTEFFSPIKTGFDFFMQLASDRFSLESKTFRLVNHTPGKLPLVDLKDSWYKDVLNVMQAFHGVAVKDLIELSIDGIVELQGIELSGSVKIENKSEKPIKLHELLAEKGISKLENMTVIVGIDGLLSVS